MSSQSRIWVDVYGRKCGNGPWTLVDRMPELEAKDFVDKQNAKPGAYITYEIRRARGANHDRTVQE